MKWPSEDTCHEIALIASFLLGTIAIIVGSAFWLAFAAWIVAWVALP